VQIAKLFPEKKGIIVSINKSKPKKEQKNWETPSPSPKRGKVRDRGFDPEGQE
jgi:hypothetical protein